MEDLFSDLSSISDCDDECLLNISTKNSKCFYIVTTTAEVVLEIPPAYKLEIVDVRKQKTLEEKNCETDSKGELTYDKWVQTDQIEMESISCLADLPPTYREATYSESALERVLRHMSAHLHRLQLQQWLADQPQRNASFHIKPVQTKTIYRAVYNREKNTFILLLHIPEENRYFIELRSLKNLLKSIKHEIQMDCFFRDEKVHLFSSHHFVVLFSPSTVLVMEIDNLENFKTYSSQNIVSVMFLAGNLCFMNSSGILTKLETSEKILECSPLLNPIISSFAIGNRINVVSSRSISSFSGDSPLDYESYETENNITKGEIKKFGENHLMIFDRTSQTCFIWEINKPKSPSHLLCFGSSEYTVDVDCDDVNLYSLTAAGVVSVWKLRPNGLVISIRAVGRECAQKKVQRSTLHHLSQSLCEASLDTSAGMKTLLLLAFVIGMTAGEEIKDLPGLDFEPNFKHYSGFFQVSDNHVLHYWFVESQNEPSSDPLIFWFNGGPGCSSLDGLLNEMGPYVANEDGKTLRENEYSWNKMASVVYIESPAGVGYSYATDGNITTNDDLTSLENYEAVKQFFTEFPQFRHHQTFIMGESYGGVYVPTLTARIVDGQKDFPINLKGMALGNGYVNEKLNIDTSIRFAYGHGLIDQKIWNTLERDCCSGCIDSCDLTQVTGHCATLVEDIFQFLWFGGLNPYDLYRDCDPNPSVNSKRMSHMLRGVAPAMARFDAQLKNQTKTKLYHYLKNKSQKPLTADVPCLNDTEMLSYMNDPKVRKAIHIPFNLGKWDICSDKVTTTYQKQYTDMTPFIKKIVKNHVRVLLYYGDTDMACNFMMGQQFADQLGIRRTLKKTPWKYDRQIAGFKTLFDGLSFITIRGAGHMAPQWRAPQMYYAVQQFLLNHPL